MTKGNWTLRRMDSHELEALYLQRIEPDFPRAERPSLAAMSRHLKEGLQDVYIMTDGQSEAAYAVCAQANGIVLVTLLAVYAEQRGGGRGSALLSLLAAQFKDRRAIVLEVEDPLDAQEATDRTTRERRIAFYERSGYRLLPGIRHDSFGVHLLLMALPLADSMEGIRGTAVEDMQAIYHRILPDALWLRVTTVEENP